MRTKFHASLILLLLLMLLAGSCKQKSLNCGLDCTYGEELLFQSGFTNCEVVAAGNNGADITGIDPAFTQKNDFDAIDAHANIGGFAINYEDGSASQRYARIVPDPEDANNEVLQFKIVEPHIPAGNKPEKGRVQCLLSQNNCIREFYQTVSLYLHPDMAHLKTWDAEIHWLSLFEFWNNGNWTGEKYPFRVTVNLVKDAGTDQEMYFKVKGDKDKSLGGFDILWKETATHFPVPFGEWMDIELYILEGDESDGRFVMRVTPENETPVELFDLTRTTQHPREKCPDGFSHFHPLKFYTSEELISYMNASGKDLEVYWDDWAMYRDKKP